jgi:hypothetical protein
MHATSAAGNFAVLALQDPRPLNAAPGPAAQAASWIAFAIFVVLMTPVALWLLSRFAKLIVLAERDDPYDRLYLEDNEGHPMEIPVGLKKPGELGYRPDLDPNRSPPRSTRPPTDPG